MNHIILRVKSSIYFATSMNVTKKFYFYVDFILNEAQMSQANTTHLQMAYFTAIFKVNSLPRSTPTLMFSAF